MPSIGTKLVLTITSLLGATLMSTSLAATESAGKTVAAGCNAFAGDLYARIASGDGNLVCSPFSIEAALAMTSAGARGQTLEQMNKTLRVEFPSDALPAAWHDLLASLHPPSPGGPGTEPYYQLSIANALWMRRDFSFNEGFLGTAQGQFDAVAKTVDFANTEPARGQINSAVSEQTHGKISELLPPRSITPLTRLVLTNAIYFKGRWTFPFDATATKELPFRTGKSGEVTAPMMSRIERLRYTDAGDFAVCELPYAGSPIAMDIVLPKADDGLAKVEAMLAGPGLDEKFSSLQSRRVMVTLPKFKVTSQFSLGDVLSKMGMPDAFSPDTADFSGMTSAEKISIGAVLHQALVDVDENGTEAAAATAVVMVGATAMQRAPEPPVEFKADHPFLFVLRDTASGAILFVGRVTNPKG